METKTIELKGSIGVSHVEQLHSEVNAAMQLGQAIRFDYQSANDIDASIMQLMIAARTAAIEYGTQIEFAHVSDQLATSLQSHGASFLVTSQDRDGTELVEEEAFATLSNQ